MATEPIPDQIIGTPKPSSRSKMRRASLILIGLSLPALLIGIEIWRLGIIRWIAVIVLVAAIPVFLLGATILIWGPVVPTLVVAGDEVSWKGRKRKRTIIRLADIVEILLAGPQSAPSVSASGLRIPTSADTEHHWLVLLKTPYDDLADSVKREFAQSTLVYNRSVKIIDAGAYQESVVAIGQALAQSASVAQGRPVPFRELTADGPEEFSEHRLAMLRATDAGKAVPPPTVVPVGTRCVECDFDLRQRPWDSVCPECGTPVRHSAEGHLLRVADRAWLRKVRRGAGMLGLGWSISMMAIFLPVLAILASGRPRGGRPTMEMQTLAVIGIALGLAYLLIAIGTWYLTVKEPRHTEHTDNPWSRGIARCTIPLPLIVGLLLLGTTVPSFRIVIMIVIALAVVAWFTLAFAARLLHRIPHRGWALAAQGAATLIVMIALTPLNFAVTKYFPGARTQPAPAVTPATQPAPIDRSMVLRIVMPALGIAFISLLFVSVVGCFWKLHAAVRIIIAEGNLPNNGVPRRAVTGPDP